MAISKQRKDDLLAQYEQLIQDSRALFLAEYKGLNVKKLQELRTEVRKVDGYFAITKNTLMKIALDQGDGPVPADILNGQMASGFALGEIPALAKVLVDFSDKEENFVIRGGIMGQAMLSADQIESLARLPSLEQLRGQLLGVISGPARNLAGTVAAGMRQVINVIDAYAKLEDDAEAEAEAA